MSLVAWLLPGVMDATYEFMRWCQGFLARCLEHPLFIELFFVWSGVAVVSAGLMYGFVKGGWGLISARRALKRMPLADRGLSVVLIRDDNVKTAFTHGLLRPRIYISTGLIKGLSREEFMAVWHHELYHMRKMDPLRSFLLTVAGDAFFYLPVWRYLERYFHSLRECKADDSAVERSGGVIGLSAALVKLARYDLDHRGALWPVSIRGTGHVEERVRRLIEGAEMRVLLPTWRSVVCSVVVSAFIVLSLSMSYGMPAALHGKDCEKDRCSLHSVMTDKRCAAHCKRH